MVTTKLYAWFCFLLTYSIGQQEIWCDGDLIFRISLFIVVKWPTYQSLG
jgi:hypothetical protein